MSTKKFFTIFMIIFMLFSVSGCGGSGGHTQDITNNPVSPDKPAPIHEPKSDDITIIPEPSPLSQDKPVSQEPIPTPIISHDPVPTPILYTVTFNSNGGSAVSSITVSSGNTVTKPNDPSKYGYTFDGWYKDSALTQVFRFGENGDKVTGNITLYAKWIETDRLRAEIAIGKISIGYQDGDNANSVTKNLTLPTFVNASGDVNVLWSSNAPSVISNSGIVTRPSDNDVVVSLTAQITVGSETRNKTFTVTVLHEVTPAPSGYTVTFNSNGGSAVASIHTSSGGIVIMPENPVREGYVFAGWYKDEAFTEIFTFGADGDKITKDTTLYAQWINTDTLRAEYALDEIVIGYADGNNPKYVTSNLTIPTKIDGVNISWSSSNAGVVSSNGKVTRPSGHDTDVTLTATALSGSQSASKTFNVKVIRARSRVSSDIPVVDIQDIVSEDFSIRYETSSDQIADIEGNYSRITIQNADDALDAIQGIHVALGINNPYDELQTSVVTSDSSGAEYQFQQVYNGVRVYGYGIMASANSDGKGDFLHANILSSDLLAKLDRSTLRLRTSSEAENAVVSHYSGSIEATSADTELIIFALGEYENNPVYAYIVNVSGTDGNGEYVDETVIINAATSAIIWKSPNINEANHSIRIKGKNESGDIVSFPLKLSNGYWNMIDDTEEPTIEIYAGDYIPDKFYFTRVPTTLIRREISEELIGWDTQAVSAYTNMREILRWWRETFGRNSLDDKGMTVKVVVHQNRWKESNGIPKKDNACWYYDGRIIYIYDNQKYDRSYGSCIDIMTHESAHAVLSYTTGFKDWGEESPLRAISEGYADVFACIKDKNWKFGENLFSSNGIQDCMRNIETKYVGNANDAYPTDAYVDSVHYVSYLAYLMYQNGLTWDELAKVWYKSMSMGYTYRVLWWTEEKKALNKDATFEVVHECVRWAAEKLAEAGEFPREKLFCVYNALAKVFYSPATLSGTVTDYDTGKPIANAFVVIDFSSSSYNLYRNNDTDKNGKYSRRLYNEDGKCNIRVSAKGYSLVQIYGVDVEASTDNQLDIQLVKQDGGDSSLSGTIRISSDNYTPLDSVKVGIKTGWNSPEEAFLETSTDENGQYLFEALGSGYYTIELAKAGYKTTTFNVIVSGNTTEQDWNMEEGSDVLVYDIPIDEEHFPDEEFRWHINAYIDKDRNGILSKSEIENTTEISINYDAYSSLISLKGIEYFVALQSLSCFDQKRLKTLDVSMNKALQSLNCAYSGIEMLNIGKNTALTSLNCSHSQLIELNVNGCSALKWLRCDESQLTTLSVNGCTALQELDCDSNKLTELDVSNNKALIRLECRGNQLTTLNVSGCNSLTLLFCYGNQLTTIDLSSTSITQHYNVYDDPTKGVACDAGVAITWSAPSLSGNIPIDEAHFPDDVFREYVRHFDANSDDKLGETEIENVTKIDIYTDIYTLGLMISSLEGVEYFKALQMLNCAGNQLTVLDLSKNTALQWLNCNGSQLTTLDVSGCTALQHLYCEGNHLTALDVSKNTALQELDCYNNQLTTLDLSKNTVLQSLSCADNQLTTLDLSKNTALTHLWCSNNRLTTLDLSNCPNLYNMGVICDDGVTIIWATPRTFTASALNSSRSASPKFDSDSTVLAVLQAFTPEQSGTYAFTVLLDRTPPEDSSLLLLSDSEDIHGSFTLTESPNTVIVSADFTAGRRYAPVIVATSESENQSGGCNTGITGIIIIAGIMVAILTKKQ